MVVLPTSIRFLGRRDVPVKLLKTFEVVGSGVDTLIGIGRWRGRSIEIEEVQQLDTVADIDPAVVVDIERLGASRHRALRAGIGHVYQVDNRICQIEPQI